MNTFASCHSSGSQHRRRSRSEFRVWALQWRRPIGSFLCGAVLALQLAIVWHDADHLWHDTHHDNTICAVAAASPIGGVAECVIVAVPTWCVICAVAVAAVRRSPAALAIAYQSRAPPQSIG